ncbi:hypothetical protein SPFM1_00156 [Salmonella phage SPFM1]|nr:hypothetical protein SPFM1_00156 [Salmonella phage SPFM1]
MFPFLFLFALVQILTMETSSILNGSSRSREEKGAMIAGIRFLILSRNSTNTTKNMTRYLIRGTTSRTFAGIVGFSGMPMNCRRAIGGMSVGKLSKGRTMSNGLSWYTKRLVGISNPIRRTTRSTPPTTHSVSATAILSML